MLTSGFYFLSWVSTHAGASAKLWCLRRRTTWLAGCGLGWACLVAGSVFAAQSEAGDQLEKALAVVATFQYGQDAAPLLALEQLVTQAATDPKQRAELEARLVTLLSGTATRDGKEVICRQLFFIGTAKSVPALEALLLDPALSHVARSALARNEDPAAGEALCRALGRASGPIQAGIANSLGDRRLVKAVPELRRLLTGADATVAEAAATALGKIGGSEAVASLEAASIGSAPNVRRRALEGLLLVADALVLAGDRAEATRIYQLLCAEPQPQALRLAGLRGLLAAEAGNAPTALAKAIRNSDGAFQTALIGLARAAKGPGATQALVGLLPSLLPEAQVVLLGVLASRGDQAALPAVLTATRSSAAEVRLAALAALGELGEAAQVSLLLEAAFTATGREQQVARGSLLRLSRGEVDSALVRALGSNEAKRQVEALRAVAGRRMVNAVPAVVPLASGGEASVRREAIRALGVLVDESTLPVLLGLTLKAQTGEDLAEIEQAVTATFERVRDPDRQARPMLAILASAPPANQPALLRLLGRSATPEALAAVRASMRASDSAVQEAALRVLADWPDPRPVEDLLAQIRTASDPKRKIIALRGFVRQAGLSQNAAALYARAFELAERVEDKKLVLGSLGGAEPSAAITLVEPCLQHPELRAEAASAAIQIADRLRQTDGPRAKALTKQALAVAVDPNLRQRGQEVLNQIEQFEGHILDWLISRPFQAKDKDAHALFDLVFTPERSEVSAAAWTPLTKGRGAWDINLADALGGADDVVAYARTSVWSPADCQARLEVGSDDGIKVWLNGVVVLANNTERGLAPRQDATPVKLKTGRNELVLKVTNRAGGWAFCCRLRQLDGAALDGLKFDASLPPR